MRTAVILSLTLAMVFSFSQQPDKGIYDIPPLGSKQELSAPGSGDPLWKEAESMEVYFQGPDVAEIISGSREGAIPGIKAASLLQQAGFSEQLAGKGVTSYAIPEKEELDMARMRAMDEHARKTNAGRNMELSELVKELVAPARNEMEMARVLFTWVALNVSYDDKNFNKGVFGDNTAEGTFRNGTAVCQGYSDLLQVMALLAGMDARMVIGYSKGIAYQPGQRFSEPDHAWNAIKINGQWELFDATWASGYGTVEKGKLVTIPRFDDYWFATPPGEFIFSHYPQTAMWQLTGEEVSLQEYEKMPGVTAAFFELGFNGDVCLEEVLDGELESFPMTYLSDGSIQALSLPSTRVIPSGKKILIALESGSAASIAVVNNGQWSMLEKDGNEFEAVIEPQRGDLSIAASFEKGSQSYQALLAYEVK